MTLKVTFDTNVFTRFIDLQPSEDYISYINILELINSKFIIGYFSDTFITLEGVQNSKRSQTFGSRKIIGISSSESTNIIHCSIGAAMIEPQLDQQHKDTIIKLLDLGLKGLRGPAYLGDNFVVPSNFDIYESITVDMLMKYREKMQEVEIAIAKLNIETEKNVGKCRARELGLNYLKNNSKEGEIWYQGLQFVEKKSKVNKAISEWADSESIIRHIGYGNDYFCTLDNGKSSRGASIFDDTHKKWLACNFGVKFVTPNELIDVFS